MIVDADGRLHALRIVDADTRASARAAAAALAQDLTDRQRRRAHSTPLPLSAAAVAPQPITKGEWEKLRAFMHGPGRDRLGAKNLTVRQLHSHRVYIERTAGEGNFAVWSVSRGRSWRQLFPTEREAIQHRRLWSHVIALEAHDQPIALRHGPTVERDRPLIRLASDITDTNHARILAVVEFLANIRFRVPESEHPEIRREPAERLAALMNTDPFPLANVAPFIVIDPRTAAARGLDLDRLKRLREQTERGTPERACPLS